VHASGVTKTDEGKVRWTIREMEKWTLDSRIPWAQEVDRRWANELYRRNRDTGSSRSPKARQETQADVRGGGGPRPPRPPRGTGWPPGPELQMERDRVRVPHNRMHEILKAHLWLVSLWTALTTSSAGSCRQSGCVHEPSAPVRHFRSEGCQRHTTTTVRTNTGRSRSPTAVGPTIP